MSKLILFSVPSKDVMSQISEHIFPSNIENKVIAFVPAEGMSKFKEKYKVFWEGEAEKHGYKIQYIDLEVSDFEAERSKLKNVSVLVVTGGNTFTLMNYLNKTGFGKDIKEFIEKDNSIYVGFSAGAIVLSPTIKVAGYGWTIGHDENEIGLEDTNGLGAVDFEIVPHFDASVDSVNLEKYRAESSYEVKTVSNDEFILLNL